MGIIVLIGGGHAAGKKSTVKLLQEEISAHFPLAQVTSVDIGDYEESSGTTPRFGSADGTPAALVIHKGGIHGTHLKPSRFNFTKLKNDLKSAQIDQGSDDKTLKIFLVHGLYALYDRELRDMSELKVFIDSDPDTRLIRWIRRDVIPETGSKCSLEDVISEYLSSSRAEMNNYIFPTKEFADVIMPRGAEKNAVSLIFDGLLPYFSNSKPKSTVTRSNYLRPSDDKSIFYDVN